ncbi:acyl carrier protein [Streptomyces sp. ASQP_92]|uniref:acyl carrier protein n=1 Tax=Streptomyces sp. ASQP_92 TaxID=2979116 RepID=UPI0021C02EAA|nr:acyl carrier protein [Streptomyces sp. ASQP_92]MCT9091621.1 acyl carrier protein [Streptomyces sp. ASQP_92]
MSGAIDLPEVTQWLTSRLATLLEVPTQEIDTEGPLDALGVTSMEETMIASELEQRYGLLLPVSEMRRHPSVDLLCAHLRDLAAANPAQGSSEWESAV